MTHIEGVLKSFQVDDSGSSIIFSMKGYDGQIYEAGFDLEDFLNKTIKNEKIGLILYEDLPEDYVSIRGVAKSIPLTAKYSGNL